MGQIKLSNEDNFLIKEKYRLWILIFLFISLVILGIFLFSNLIDYLSVLEKKEIDAIVKVNDENKIGIEVNNTALAFGEINKFGSSQKILTIFNNFKRIVKIKIYVKGNIAEFMQTSENNFFLSPNQTRNVTFIVSIPKNTPTGEYSGKVYILSTNPTVR